MGHILEVYDNGNCNGFPFASMEINGRIYDFYPNGNCNGCPLWSMEKTDRYTEVYEWPGRNCIPCNYFKYVPPGRWGGKYGGVEFYPNGNGNGIPEFFFSFCSENKVVFYPTGNTCGIPNIAYFEKCGRTVYFYPNGNGNGNPTATIDKVDDIKDVIDLVFYLFIPHGQKYRPNEVIRTDTRSTDYGSGNGRNSRSSSSNGSNSCSSNDHDDTLSGRMDPDRDSEDYLEKDIDFDLKWRDDADFDFGPGCTSSRSQTVRSGWNVFPHRGTRMGHIVGGFAKPLSGAGGGFDVPDWIEPLFKFIVLIGVLAAAYWALKRFYVFFFE